MVLTEVTYAPGLVVKDAVGATVSTVMIRVDARKLFSALPTMKLFDASRMTPEFNCTEPLVPLVQSIS